MAIPTFQPRDRHSCHLSLARARVGTVLDGLSPASGVTTLDEQLENTGLPGAGRRVHDDVTAFP